MTNSDELRRVRAIAKQLKAQGWTVTLTRRGHFLAKSADGQHTVTFSVGKDWRAQKNTVARLRRAGAEIMMP